MPNRKPTQHSPKTKVAGSKRRRGGFGVSYALISAAVIILVLAAGATAFFRVEQFKITGNGLYTRAQIIEASGLETGDNMYLFNKFKVIEKICAKLPYVDGVEIDRRLPATLIITVTETKAAAAVCLKDGTCALINYKGKVLENISPEDAVGVITVTGVPALKTQPGKLLKTQSASQLQTLTTLIQAIDKNALGRSVSEITFETAYSISMRYEARFTVELGTPENLDKKVLYLMQIVSRLNKSDMGVIDLRGNTFRFIPKTETDVAEG